MRKEFVVTLADIKRWLVETQYLGNEPWRFVLLALTVLAGLVAGRIVRYLVEQAGERIQKEGRRPLTGVLCFSLGRPLTMLGFTVGIYVGIAFVNLSVKLAAVASSCIATLVALTVGYTAYRLVDIIDHALMAWAAKTESKIDDMLVPLVRKALRVTVVIIVAMFIVEQFAEERITTLLAGLGVGGLAVALAAQDTVKNFFGSLMILADKPFQVGDRVVIGAHEGPVEEVGFRSTKIRTLEGHLVTIPNSAVTNEMVRNVSKRPHIRRLMNITITYDTPRRKIERAVQIVRELLENHEGIHPDFPPRVYFNDFNADSLNILAIYWYHPPDFWKYLEFSQRINLELVERFAAEGIEFAFPTQTLYLANDEKRQLAVRLLNENAGMPKS